MKYSVKLSPKSSFQDELIAVAEKSVLRVVDLLDWLAPPRTVHWARGAKVSVAC